MTLLDTPTTKRQCGTHDTLSVVTTTSTACDFQFLAYFANVTRKRTVMTSSSCLILVHDKREVGRKKDLGTELLEREDSVKA